MRILFNNIDHPKKSAKRIQKAFKFVADAKSYDPKPFNYNPSLIMPSIKYKEIKPIKLSEAQFLVAYMLGYDDWHELEVVTASYAGDRSPIDEELSEEEQEDRLIYQWSRLNEHYPNGRIDYVTHAGRVSAKSPTSKKLFNRIGLENTLIFDEQLGEWKLIESRRSHFFGCAANNIQEGFEYGSFNLGEAQAKVNHILEVAPESINTIWASLSIFMQAGDIDVDHSELANYFSDEIEALEMSFIRALPEFFWTEGVDQSMNFSDIHSRDPIRITSMLGHLFYYQKDYAKARKWFGHMQNMSDYFDEPYAPIINDLKKTTPSGTAQPEFEDRTR